MALTTRERLFVTYYLGKAEGNGTLAATMAGYGNPAVAASRLIRRDKIRRAIDAKLDKAAMDADEVLARLSDLGRANMSDFVSIGANGLPDLDLDKARRRGKLSGVKKLKASRVGGGDESPPMEIVELELHSPIQALALLAKYHGLTGETPSNEDLSGKTEAELEEIARDKGGRRT